MLVVEVIRGEIKVIHYTTSTSSKTKKALFSGSNIVMEEVLQISEKIERVQYLDHVGVYSPKDAIKRARSRVGEQDYSVFFNNCEALVNWAVTSKDVTDQGTAAAVLGATVGVGVVAAAAYGVHTLLHDDSEKNKKENET